MTERPDLSQLSADQVRQLAEQLMGSLASSEQAREKAEKTAVHLKAVNEKLTYELAVLKRHRFGKRSEHLSVLQGELLDELVDADISAIETELAEAAPVVTPAAKTQPKRAPLPPELPRTVIHHEPENPECPCGCTLKRIGEDVSEKLDYTPGTFTVERHVRGKWVCEACDTLTQAPVPAQVIDKGLPTSGLLAQVLIQKYADHLPLYRQEQIFARAGVPLARSTLADWVGQCGVQLQPLVDALRHELLEQSVIQADETPVPMLSPGKKKTHSAYIWAYASTPYSELQAVVYDFTPGRAGVHARTFLEGWRGHLVCDDYAGYKAAFSQGITEVGCMAHARRKFFDLHEATGSEQAAQALELISRLYDIEREIKPLSAKKRQQHRQRRAKPIADRLREWMILQRQRMPASTALAKAMDYSLKRWEALTRYLDDGRLPIDNNRVENQIRPWALGRSNWLFAGSLRSGQRAAAVMSLIQSAKLNGLEPHAYLTDVLKRLPTCKASEVSTLLPHRWQPQQ